MVLRDSIKCVVRSHNGIDLLEKWVGVYFSNRVRNNTIVEELLGPKVGKHSYSNHTKISRILLFTDMEVLYTTKTSDCGII